MPARAEVAVHGWSVRLDSRLRELAAGAFEGLPVGMGYDEAVQIHTDRAERSVARGLCRAFLVAVETLGCVARCLSSGRHLQPAAPPAGR